MNAPLPAIATATATAILPRVDPRLVILARAGALHSLVEAGEVTIDYAFGELVEGVVAIVPDALSVGQTVERWEQLFPYVPNHRGRR